jgi:hypothetical protein
MAQYTLRIPELANAELKISVDVERVPAWLEPPADVPSFAALRPSRIVVNLGGEEIYLWQRKTSEVLTTNGETPAAARPRR